MTPGELPLPSYSYSTNPPRPRISYTKVGKKSMIYQGKLGLQSRKKTTVLTPNCNEGDARSIATLTFPPTSVRSGEDVKGDAESSCVRGGVKWRAVALPERPDPSRRSVQLPHNDSTLYPSPPHPR